jgi:hypothetical protein
MGFRDLETFNLAFLGKHGWILMTHRESLCARVLKTKYFPDTDFLHATVPRRSSATWRAIVAGREALNTGLLKRIGDGTTVSVWTDNWIPGIISMRPPVQISVGDDADVLNRVSDLIDSDSWTWKRDLVRKNFTAPHQRLMLS